MKRILMIACAAALVYACGNPENAEHKNKNDHAEAGESATGTFGAAIDEAGAVSVSQLMADMGNSAEMDAKVTATISECCRKKGCWMNVDKGDGSTMKVTFKDYAFFVPKNADGKTAVFQGKAYYDTLSVETLRHYAEDAGKSKEEIEKINEPKVELAFEADGVIIK